MGRRVQGELRDRRYVYSAVSTIVALLGFNVRVAAAAAAIAAASASALALGVVAVAAAHRLAASGALGQAAGGWPHSSAVQSRSLWRVESYIGRTKTSYSGPWRESWARAAEKTSLLVSYTASYAQLRNKLAHVLALKKRGVAYRPYQSDPLPPHKKLSVARAP